MTESNRIPPAVKVAAALLLVITILGLGAPWIAPYDPNEQADPAAGRLRPPMTRMIALRLDHDRWMLADRVERQGDRMILYTADTERSVGVDEIRNLDAEGRVKDQRLFVLGSDELGRDLFSRWLFGAQISLLIAVFAAALASTLGIAIGALAALGGHWIDLILMRLVDGLLAFPWIFLLIALTAFIPSGITPLILILGCTGWMSISRLARGEIQSLRDHDFVRAARGLGMTETAILFRHVLPNVWTPLAIATTLRVGYLILVEASLSFLGLGVQPPQASWGNMIAAGRNLMASAWWILTFPALGLVVTVVALHWVGDQIRDVLDPRRRTALPEDPVWPEPELAEPETASPRNS